MNRYLERLNLAHVITTCFGLMYLIILTSGWLSLLNNPFFGQTISSWAMFIAFGLILGAAGWFLVRELLRQARLFRQRRSS